MLTNLSFQNFKSWKDTGNIRLAPITGLFGTNSSGKTAILQLLLMLKQTVESSDRQRVLHFGDAHTYVDLGTSYDAIYQHHIPGQLDFSISWQSRFPRRIEPRTIDSRSITFTASVDLNAQSISVSQFAYRWNDENDNPACLGMKRHGNNDEAGDDRRSYELVAEGLNLRRRRDYRELQEEQQQIELISRESCIDLFPPPIKFYGFPARVRNVFMANPLYRFEQEFEDSFEHIYYLGPLREHPQRIYPWSGGKPQDVGSRGEFVVDALLSSSFAQNTHPQNPTVDLKVAFWLRELGLIYDFQLQAIADYRREYEIRVRRTQGSVGVPITDVGFGVSQILPVLTLCYYVPRGSTIILEQPEIHLHPSVQAGLADVFIDAIKTRNIQIILESHSEHLLRRLQRRIAEERQDVKSSDAALYFCEMSDSGDSLIKPLDLDDFGNISNWPEGFFGDEMGDLVAMTEAAIKRQQRGE